MQKDSYFGDGPYKSLKKGIELRQSPTEGKGLFATEFIQKDSILWHDRLPECQKYIKIANINTLNDKQMDLLKTYGYQVDSNTVAYIDSHEDLMKDYSNFWNHSCNPNSWPFDSNTWTALRDILPNEEITVDYATFDRDLYREIENCNCKSVNCRKKITCKDYLIKELQEKYKNHLLKF